MRFFFSILLVSGMVIPAAGQDGIPLEPEMAALVR